jgi:hypothetical protein
MPDKKYNRPAQITDAVRREEMEKRRRDIAEREYKDDISASDKARMKRMIEDDYAADMPDDMKRTMDAESYRDEAYAKGGMVKKKKYAMGGSVRGGGIAIKGVGKGKVC